MAKVLEVLEVITGDEILIKIMGTRVEAIVLSKEHHADDEMVSLEIVYKDKKGAWIDTHLDVEDDEVIVVMKRG